MVRLRRLFCLVFVTTSLLFAKSTLGCKFRAEDNDDLETESAGKLKATIGLSMEQQRRLEAIERECMKYDGFLKQQKWKDSVPHMIVDDERKLLFCAVPKVASSNWKRLFINALNVTVHGSSDIRDVHAKNLLPDLRTYTPAEQEYRLKNYFKFTFVRHPLERLLSAYRNKLENREIEWFQAKNRAKEMVLRVKNPGVQVSGSGHTLTFSQFVNTLTDPAYAIKHYNVHWKQYNKLCHPCFVRYDFVGKMETFAEDLEFVKQKTGLRYHKWFGHTDRTTTPSLTEEYYKTISPRKVATLLKMYDSDMSMFGYDKI